MNLVGSKVKLFLINSLSVEGQIQLWENDKIVLTSNGKSLIINNPNQNIIMYYVLDDESASHKKEKLWEVPEPEPEPDNTIKDLNLKLKKLADLKAMSAAAQREQVRKELTTFRPVNTDQILGKYGTPSFINPQYSSPKETNDGNAVDSGELPQVPGKASE